VLPHEGVGDLVFLLPTLYALKEHLPEARIQLAFSRTQQALAGALDGKLVDAVPLYERGLTQVVRALREFGPDVYFEFDGGFRFAIAGLLSPALRRIHPPRELVKPYAAALQRESLSLEVGGHCVDTLRDRCSMRLVFRGKRVSFEFEGARAIHRERFLHRHAIFPTDQLRSFPCPAIGARTGRWRACRTRSISSPAISGDLS
jgi:hypothetical protein